MLAIATEALLVVGMIFGFAGVLGLGNAILAVATRFKARWYWHVAAWLGCFCLFVADIYFGADAGMWCLSNNAVPEHMRCGQ